MALSAETIIGLIALLFMCVPGVGYALRHLRERLPARGQAEGE